MKMSSASLLGRRCTTVAYTRSIDDLTSLRDDVVAQESAPGSVVIAERNDITSSRNEVTSRHHRSLLVATPDLIWRKPA
jgi:hypothetical protein